MKRLADLIRSYRPESILTERPYIIAEAGVNHGCDMDIAVRMIEEAKEGGADAIKFQTYKAETIASKDSPSYWDLNMEPTNSQYQLFRKYDRFWKNEFEMLKVCCDRVGIEFISTPFDIESATFLNDLMDVYKISSSDLNNRPFIEFMCGFGKPVLLSTGASYMWEVEESAKWIMTRGNPLALLHCVLNYPTDDTNANLAAILHLRRRFPETMIGYSDHTLPGEMKCLEIAVLLGAAVVEKHFTYDKTLPGNDHYHAMDKNDLMRFRKNLNQLFRILGDGQKEPLETEQSARRNARRSLVAAHSIESGEKIGPQHITWKRPGHGIDPRDYDRLIGRKAKERIEEDTILQWSMFDA